MFYVQATFSNIASWVRDTANIINTLSSSVTELMAGTSQFVTLSAAPSSPVKGQTYFDTTLNKARTWDGTAWQNLW
jgi:hypothetical protein